MTAARPDAAPSPGTGPLRTVLVTSAADAEAWRAEWEALVERSADSQVTKAPFWLLAWWRVFGATGGRALRLGLFLDGERLVGVAPLLSRVHRHRGLLPFRRLELLGTGEHGDDEIASEYVGLVAEPGHERRFAGEFARAVAQGVFGPCDELLLTSTDAEARLSGHVPGELSRHGFAVESVSRSACPYARLPATWDDYLASLSSSGRYLVRRSLREFDTWADGRARLHRASNRDELEEGKRVLVRLHEERWRAAGKDGVFASFAFRTFHDAVMPELLARGALDLLWLTVDDQPVAAVYNLVWKNRVQFYQSGRSTAVPDAVRPGIVLHAHAIRHAIEAGRTEYDFLGRTRQYKAKLAGELRPLLDVRAVRPGARELARQWTERGVDLARELRNRSRRLAAVASRRPGAREPG